MNERLTFFLSLLVFVLSCGPSKPEPAHAQGAKSPSLFSAVRLMPREEAAGRQLFLYYCVFCHGAEADGNGINASLLPKPPTDFTAPEFAQHGSSEELAETIRSGRPHSICPPWGGRLSSREIHSLAAYLEAVMTPVNRGGAEGTEGKTSRHWWHPDLNE